MKRKILLVVLDLPVLALVGTGITRLVWQHRPETPASAFARAVDLSPLQGLPVQTQGRVKAFDSFAREQMRYISGRGAVEGQSALFTYLDLMLRPEAYEDVDTLYVKNQNVRQRIIEALGADAPKDWAERFLDRGLVSRAKLRDPRVAALLDDIEKDVMRTSKDVDAITTALGLSDPSRLMSQMTIVPPPAGGLMDRWSALSDLVGPPNPEIEAHAGLSTDKPIPGREETRRAALTDAWDRFVTIWQGQDPVEASSALTVFVGEIRGLAPAWYPSADAMRLENWYFRNQGMTWVWLAYLAAVVPLLMFVVYRWRRARWIGLLLFAAAFGLHTVSLVLRWKVAQRWPNSNMFEAVHTAAWFGVVAAWVLEWVVRKTPMRNLFALGASVCAMAALMAGRYTDQITPEINNVMPILDDIWLYIHTNMIIWSYALIGMAAVTASLYLRYRLGGGGREVAKAGGAGMLILAGARGGNALRDDEPATVGQVLDGATMIVMELAFVMLWTGLVMGAIWADHSWGRPWGWDPKEVFALNTFLIFLLLVHVRYKVRDKGLWTAVLAVVGCGVMLFNWIVINFHISGLHSYA